MALFKGMLLGAAALVAGSWLFNGAAATTEPAAPPPPRDCTAEEQAGLVQQLQARVAPDVAQAVYFRRNETVSAKSCVYRPTTADYRVEAVYSFKGSMWGDAFTAEAVAIAPESRVGFNAFGYTYLSANLNDAAAAKSVGMEITARSIEAAASNS